MTGETSEVKLWDHRSCLTDKARRALLRGKAPAIVASAPPKYRPGDRIVLIWDRSTGTRQPRRSIMVLKVSRKDGKWITDYALPDRTARYLKPGAGTTSDRLKSIDREVEAEEVNVSPADRQNNTLAYERRRIMEQVERHELRARTTANSRTKERAMAQAMYARRKLDDLAA